MTVASNDPLMGAVIEEMRDVADRLCRLACILTGDPQVITNHFDELQSLDLLTQIQRTLADVLSRAGSIDERLSGMGLEALAERLRDRALQTAA
jgi:hypothetical protein